MKKTRCVAHHRIFFMAKAMSDNTLGVFDMGNNYEHAWGLYRAFLYSNSNAQAKRAACKIQLECLS